MPRRHAFRAASGPADRRTRHTGGRARAAGVRLHPRARPAVASSRRPAARIVHRFVEENFDQISASLAFTTLLSLVPFITLVAVVLSKFPQSA